METTHLNFNMADRIGLKGLLTQRFFHAALERGLREVSTFDTRSEATLEDVDKLFSSIKNVTRFAYLPIDPLERALFAAYMYDLGDMLIFVGFNNRYNWETMGVAKDRARLDMAMAAVKMTLPIMKTGDPNIIPINFWSMSGDDVRVRVRRIEVPSWVDMAINYTEPTREQLVKLMTLRPPMDDFGRLILWHGVAGTGKSYGIRSLAQAWQRWCDIHYIVDPEKFFGDADYMLQVILQNETCGAESCAPSAPPTEDEEDTYKGTRWNLLIMEDSDEFLTVDAKQRKGQSMSRLLNLTSGFIGQGLNVLTLITTNEPVDKIHTALQREGRCMANLEFGKLQLAEAREWADAHGIERDKVTEDTIANLYALGRRRQLRTFGVGEKAIGFQGTRGRNVEQVPTDAKESSSWGQP